MGNPDIRDCATESGPSLRDNTVENIAGEAAGRLNSNSKSGSICPVDQYEKPRDIINSSISSGV